MSDSISNTNWIDNINHHSTDNCFFNNNIEEFIFGKMDKSLIKTLMIKNREDRFNTRKNPIDKWFGDNIPVIK